MTDDANKQKEHPTIYIKQVECATNILANNMKKRDLDLRLFPQPKKLVKQRVSWPQKF